MKGARGESVLKVGEREYPLLYTNRALAEAEQRTGKTVVAIARGAGNGDLGIGDIAALLLTGMEAARREANKGGKGYTMANAFDLLDQVGFGNAAAAVIEGLGAVLSYDPEGEEGGATDETDGPLSR